MSIVGYGAIAQGLASIRQCLDIIIRTTKGSDVLRPEFGSEVYKYIDRPMNIAISNMKRAILEAVELWETRVQITKIDHKIDPSYNSAKLIFDITYIIKDDLISDRILIELQNGIINTVANDIILQAFFPPNPDSKRYSVNLTINGDTVFPRCPDNGFETTDELFDWINENWGYVGTWHLLIDRIVCYVRLDNVSSASIEISLLESIRTFEADFPLMMPGETLVCEFIPDGMVADPAMPITFNTPGQVLAWAQANWSDFGTWSIEATPGDNNQFSNEFSEEFESSGDSGYKLVLTTDVVLMAALNIFKA